MTKITLLIFHHKNEYSNKLAPIVDELVYQLVLAHKLVPSIKYRLGQCQRRSGSVDLQKM